jgi:CBS domain-containing protein
MTFAPPLGFFRQFVLERGGEHKETLNLKLNGVIPIVELARIHSLASGELRVNTRRRLRGAARRGRLNRNDAKSLEDALELIDSTRLNHQARQLRAGEQPDNYVHPKSLSPLARDHLKAAFGVVRTSQQALMNSFGLA